MPLSSRRRHVFDHAQCGRDVFQQYLLEFHPPALSLAISLSVLLIDSDFEWA